LHVLIPEQQQGSGQKHVIHKSVHVHVGAASPSFIHVAGVKHSPDEPLFQHGSRQAPSSHASQVSPQTSP